MKLQRINADKPHLWTADIAASFDKFNQWFIRFAPEAFRSTRVKTTEQVKTALLATQDLRNLNPDKIKKVPGTMHSSAPALYESIYSLRSLTG